MEKQFHITHEDAVRKFQALKRQKSECVERMTEYMRRDYLKRTGEELKGVEVW